MNSASTSTPTNRARTARVPRTAPAASRSAPRARAAASPTTAPQTHSTPTATPTRAQTTPSARDALARIGEFVPPHERALGCAAANVLLVGAAAVGKSSFINAVLTALERREHLALRAPVGGAAIDSDAGSVTTRQLERYDVAPRVVLWDTWGGTPDGEAAYDAPLMRAMLDGALGSPWPLGAPLADAQPVPPSETLSRQMHAVLLFISANDVLDADGVMARAARWVAEARGRGVPCTVVLSQCDQIDESVGETPQRVHTSEAVQIARSTAASLLQVPLNSVHAVKTYYSEMTRVPAIDALVLNVLDTALGNAAELLRRRYNQRFGAHSAVMLDGSEAFVALNIGDSSSTSADADDDENGSEPLSSLSRRLQPFTQRMAQGWSPLFVSSSYDMPPSTASGIWRRVYANWNWLLANYLALVLLVWLGFALVHVSLHPQLAAGVAAVALLWLVLFRLVPRTVVVRGVRLGKSHKELLLLVAMALLLLALLRAVGTQPLAYMACGLVPALVLHSLFYRRAERYIAAGEVDGAVKGV